MKKYLKILVLLLSILFLSGCSINYNLNINDGVDEKIEVYFETSKCNSENTNCETYIKNMINSTINIYNYPNYKYNYVNLGNNNSKLTLEYHYSSLEEFSQKTILTSYYNTVYINDDEINLSNFVESGEEEGPDKINVTVTSNKKIYDNNAKSVKNNEYKWNFTNKTNKKIEISFKEVKSNTDKIVTATKNNLVYIGIIILVIVLLGIGLFIYFSLKNNNANKL